ncbi:hypothetical protein [Rummeliibacillus stabekisii]|uniref:hypothetical protein n=1 Tax=Rummeliibacillus stabekisii TaxID=241244 RepID=UPI003711941C
MSIQDFLEMIEQEGINTSLYPNSFPASTSTVNTDICLMLQVNQGFALSSGLYDTVISITSRAPSHGLAEANAQDIQDRLKDRTDLYVGDSQIVRIKAEQVMPFYEGSDENKLKYYRVDLRALVNAG